MKKKILKNMRLLVLLSITLTSVLISVVFYRLSTNQLQSQLTLYLKKISMTMIDENSDKQVVRLDEWQSAFSMRVTLISQEGTILYDNFADHNTMNNHGDRKEIRQAEQGKMGFDKRKSKTLGKETIYVAVRLKNGNILRVSSDLNSFWKILLVSIPFVIMGILLILLFVNFLTKKLTREIIAPINDFQPMKDTSIDYEELTPFVKEIIHQREIIQQQLNAIQENNHLILQIINNTQEGFLFLDKDKRIRMANPSACVFLDAKDPIIGEKIIRVYRCIDFLDKVDKAFLGEKTSMNIPRNGKTIQVSFHPSEQSGVMIMMSDISEKERAEKMRREFSANVSHELKTPLTSIIGYAEMMENGLIQSDDIQECAHKIYAESERLLQMVEDILLLSRLDEQANDFFSEMVDISSILNQVQEDLYPKIIENNLKLNNSIDGQKILIEGNSRLIYELFYNLIDNAIKYNKAGGEITISADIKTDQVNINIEDTGIGINDREKETIFERFYRVDKSRSKKTGGTGLGLSIVKHIAQVHNGYIKLTSKENIGTCVMITFPLTNIDASK